ncbi:MAG TPA: tRNA lysidine(34) synthetase TilS [Clostridiaceae bacterium]|nr:tRNA lysidine(34) synthetase TilS [Clostridiaceae bacterium]
MLDKVRRTIIDNNLIEKGENVLVGVSGGPDSICLLHVLDYLSDELGIKIYAVHVNHMLRGEESDADEEYVKELCETLGVKLFNIAINVKEIAEKTGLSIEEAAREARYSEFKYLADKIGNCKIAVAHNKNDQAETVIMNIIRGTGLDGLKGMDYIRGNIIRPLLDVKREEIEEYCKQHNLKPRTDSTNLMNIYTRNKIRLDLIPYINDSFNVDIIENVVRMAELIRDDINYLKSVTEEAYKKCLVKSDYGNKSTNRNKIGLKSKDAVRCLYIEGADNDCDNIVVLDISKLRKLHRSILKRVLRLAIENVRGNIKDIESVHINQVFRLCVEGRTGAEIHLPTNVRASRSYDILKIFSRVDSDENLDESIENNTRENKFAKFQKATSFCYNLNIPGITRIEELNIEIEGTILNKELIDDIENFKKMGYNSLIQFFDYEKIKEGPEVVLRNRQKGDLIKPLKSVGTKKLKEFMIDSKIPRDIRDRILLLAKGREIVWVIGYRISDKFKVTENTKSILKLEVKI